VQYFLLIDRASEALKTQYDQPGLLRFAEKLFLAYPYKEDIASAAIMYPEITSDYLYIQLTMIQQHQGNVDSMQHFLSTTAEPCSCSEHVQRASRHTGLNLYGN
jgi:hypothetical protein